MNEDVVVAWPDGQEQGYVTSYSRWWRRRWRWRGWWTIEKGRRWPVWFCWFDCCMEYLLPLLFLFFLTSNLARFPSLILGFVFLWRFLCWTWCPLLAFFFYFVVMIGLFHVTYKCTLLFSGIENWHLFLVVIVIGAHPLLALNFLPLFTFVSIFFLDTLLVMASSQWSWIFEKKNVFYYIDFSSFLSPSTCHLSHWSYVGMQFIYVLSHILHGPFWVPWSKQLVENICWN